MASSASAIARGLINNLSAASVIGGCAVSTNYEVLETSSGCCAVVTWTDIISVPISFGMDTAEDYAHYLEIYIRDEGNSTTTMNNVYALADKVVNSIISDQTIQGTVSMVSRIQGARRPHEAIEIGGQFWIPFYITVESSIID